MAYEFKKIEKTIGAFIVIAFLLFIGAIIFIAKGQNLIAKKNYYRTTCYSASGLKSGTPIKFKGLEIGAVKKIFLDKNNQVNVRFYILRENAARVKTNSVMKISASLLGDKSLEITEGMTNSAQAANNAFIYSSHSEEGQKMMEMQASGQVKSEVDAILQNIELLTAQLANPRGALQTTLRNLQKFTMVFSGLSKDNKDSFASMIKDLRDTAKNFKEMSAGMKKNPLFSSWGASSSKKKKK